MRVLITGTTTGLGAALKTHYLNLGCEVIGVNRREAPAALHFESHTLDIANYEDVLCLLSDLNRAGRVPELFILNAGINLPDNAGAFDYRAFEKVMTTNLSGVLTFVGAIAQLGLKGVRIATLSSTSNLVPNPGHIAYSLSKKNLLESFSFLQKRNPENFYQTVVLGPVKTEIAADYPKASGLAGKIFDFLALDSSVAAKHCAAFFQSQRHTQTYPAKAGAFYWLVKLALLFFPNLYQGTLRSSQTRLPHRLSRFFVNKDA